MSGDMFWRVASAVIPALLTSTPIGPSSRATSAVPARHASKSATSRLKIGIPVSAWKLRAAASLP
jgi:hypothetical protein